MVLQRWPASSLEGSTEAVQRSSRAYEAGARRTHLRALVPGDVGASQTWSATVTPVRVRPTTVGRTAEGSLGRAGLPAGDGGPSRLPPPPVPASPPWGTRYPGPPGPSRLGGQELVRSQTSSGGRRRVRRSRSGTGSSFGVGYLGYPSRARPGDDGRSVNGHLRLARSTGRRIPLGLDVAESPDRERNNPRDHEHADNEGRRGV